MYTYVYTQRDTHTHTMYTHAWDGIYACSKFLSVRDHSVIGWTFFLGTAGKSISNLQVEVPPGRTTPEIVSSHSLSLFCLPDNLVSLSSFHHGGSSSSKCTGLCSGSLSESPILTIIKNRDVPNRRPPTGPVPWSELS